MTENDDMGEAQRKAEARAAKFAKNPGKFIDMDDVLCCILKGPDQRPGPMMFGNGVSINEILAAVARVQYEGHKICGAIEMEHARRKATETRIVRPGAAEVEIGGNGKPRFEA